MSRKFKNCKTEDKDKLMSFSFVFILSLMSNVCHITAASPIWPHLISQNRTLNTASVKWNISINPPYYSSLQVCKGTKATAFFPPGFQQSLLLN